MIVRDWLLAEFDHEMALTRQLLERLPEAAFGWKPHARAFGLGGLATHLALIPHWGAAILTGDGYDLAHDSGPPPAELRTVAEVLAIFDGHVADVRRGLTGQTDAELQATWSLRRGAHVVMSMPRFAALRTFLVSHLIHHRGQLTVYLRMRDVPLPPLYGSSGDESL
jgi:uncharacterized damage-inducible protein DinB